jgi:hypothetical protein
MNTFPFADEVTPDEWKRMHDSDKIYFLEQKVNEYKYWRVEDCQVAAPLGEKLGLFFKGPMFTWINDPLLDPELEERLHQAMNTYTKVSSGNHYGRY